MTIQQHIDILRRDGYNAASNIIESLMAELEQVKHERDAVVETVKQLKRCADCKHATIISDGAFTWVDCPKRDGRCSAKSLWQWRGIQKED